MISPTILLCLTILSIAMSFFFDKKKTIDGLKRGLKMFFALLPSLLTILILVSFLLYFIPKELIINWLGKNSGIFGIFIAAIIGSISLFPGFIAYPLCNILLNNGASYSIIAIFITTLMMVGIITLPMETKYFGFNVAVLRNILSFIGAIIIGLLISLLWRFL